jgi:hypothetical protein
MVKNPFVDKPPMKGDFSQLPNAVLRDRSISNDAKMILWHVCSKAGPDYVPTVADIDEALGCGEISGKKYRRELVAAGYAKCVGRKTPNGQHSKQWFFALWPKYRDPNATAEAQAQPEATDASAKRLKHSFGKIGVTDWAQMVAWRDEVLRVEYSKQYRGKFGFDYRFGEGKTVGYLNQLLTYIVADYASSGAAQAFAQTTAPADGLQKFIADTVGQVFRFWKFKQPGHFEMPYILRFYNEARMSAPAHNAGNQSENTFASFVLRLEQDPQAMANATALAGLSSLKECAEYLRAFVDFKQYNADPPYKDDGAFLTNFVNWAKIETKARERKWGDENRKPTASERFAANVARRASQPIPDFDA